MPNNTLVRQREQAKVGMAASLGVLVATGFLSRSRQTNQSGVRTLHVCAGVALVGFSYWHWRLYQPYANSKGRIA
ncbi:hypothetical protein [Desulfovibrio inopinatus]|uniref:hypothetical protein n=1 Tax=Desulfovibrio inopinatus TaxID=102109 RepID=UPI00040E6547|nr:hypothetical protein [Desulfovibrio inopinatus]